MATTGPPPRDRFEELLDAGRVIDHPLERRLYARDGSIAQGDCGLVVLPETTAEVVACMRLAARAGRAGRAARVGHGPLRRRGPARRRHRAVGRADDADPRRRPGGAVRAGRARGAEPRPVDGRAPPRACTTRPTPPASRPARSAATSRPTPAARTAWPPASPPSTSSAWRSCWPTARCCASAAPPPTRPGYDLRGFVVGGEGTLGVVTEVTVRLTRTPPQVRTMLLDFATVRAAGEAVGGIIAGRRHPGGDGDDGPAA